MGLGEGIWGGVMNESRLRSTPTPKPGEKSERFEPKSQAQFPGTELHVWTKFQLVCDLMAWLTAHS